MDLINLKISSRMMEIVQTLDINYGSTRNIRNDLGGFIIFLEKDEEDIVFNLLNINHEMAEYEEIYDDNKEQITESLYLLSSDYSVIIFLKN